MRIRTIAGNSYDFEARCDSLEVYDENPVCGMIWLSTGNSLCRCNSETWQKCHAFFEPGHTNPKSPFKLSIKIKAIYKYKKMSFSMRFTKYGI